MHLLSVIKRVVKKVRAPEHGSADLPPLVAKPDDFNSLMKRILGEENPIVAMDVGGANDLQPHWHRLIGNAEFVVYEPHDAAYEELIGRQSENSTYRDFRYINEALSGTGGRRTMYQTNVPSGSSLITPKKGGMGDHPYNTYFWPLTIKEIETTTLLDSLDREKIARVDMIKLDTQGTELEILTGLDRQRLSGTLLIETECSVLDIYEGGERALEDMLGFMRENGFTLFDLRTNRFIGNAVRLDSEIVKRRLGNDLDLPPNAHRLAEVDAVFARDPKSLIADGAGAGTLRRLIAAFVTYNFFHEAIFTVVSARDHGVFNLKESEELLASIGNLKSLAARGLEAFTDQIRRADGFTWAQYMWVPYPSA
jgi:FkbM family methyltransferase